MSQIPEIEIAFDQEEPVGDRFFTTDRMAAITVTEKLQCQSGGMGSDQGWRTL